MNDTRVMDTLVTSLMASNPCRLSNGRPRSRKSFPSERKTLRVVICNERTTNSEAIHARRITVASKPETMDKVASDILDSTLEIHQSGDSSANLRLINCRARAKNGNVSERLIPLDKKRRSRRRRFLSRVRNFFIRCSVPSISEKSVPSWSGFLVAEIACSVVSTSSAGVRMSRASSVEIPSAMVLRARTRIRPLRRRALIECELKFDLQGLN